jgi:FeS assembly SUF system protein
MEKEVSESQPQETSPTEDGAGIKEKIVAVLKSCYDPEIPVDIYELGLIYDIDVKSSGAVALKMTLTSPMCPVAESLPPEVESKIGKVPGITEASVEVVWDPPWTMEMMSEAAKLQLGML